MVSFIYPAILVRINGLFMMYIQRYWLLKKYSEDKDDIKVTVKEWIPYVFSAMVEGRVIHRVASPGGAGSSWCHILCGNVMTYLRHMSPWCGCLSQVSLARGLSVPLPAIAAAILLLLALPLQHCHRRITHARRHRPHGHRPAGPPLSAPASKLSFNPSQHLFYQV